MKKNIQTMVDYWLKLFICLIISMSTNISAHDYNNISITILDSAVAEAKGAVCLDGSPPAYYHAKGFGDGANNWFLYLEGGGWCISDEDCAVRLTDRSGSSKYKPKSVYFGQNKSQNQTENPDFYNWNRVYVGYCDCSSYMGDVELKTNVTRRGARVFNAIMDDLLAKGMSNAENAILSGGSAGGLGAMLHCDGFSELLPNAKRVKCISDSGFFIHAKHLPGADKRAEYYANVSAYHGIRVDSLPSSCTSRMDETLCLLPENIIRDIKTPLFIVETAFDQYQLALNYFSNESTWWNCTNNIEVCTPSQLQTIKDYGVALRQTLQEISDTTSVGIFVHPCFRHGHFYEKSGWEGSFILGDKTIAQAVGDWFFDRASFQVIDYDNELPRFRNCSKFIASSYI
ncbi:hypothetical protein MIMGU_mgv1a007660mg [Erythranthe guttata]|uniref:Pectin acetylesterase n=2 Tax=Erythranthe guttata TaxID=4155 RepID=A0A022R922_ERYGU|nr:hypothetical protein MIMGU_mgv1a007660mg [Erythranthe guttata]